MGWPGGAGPSCESRERCVNPRGAPGSFLDMKVYDYWRVHAELDLCGFPAKDVWKDAYHLARWVCRIPCKNGQWVLSVLAGASVYSSPRDLLRNPAEYFDVEVAILPGVENPNQGQWASRADLPDALKTLMEPGGNKGVLPYVSWEDVQRIYDWFA